MKLVPMQKGDVSITYADTSALEKDFGYKPSTSLRKGLKDSPTGSRKISIRGAQKRFSFCLKNLVACF